MIKPYEILSTIDKGEHGIRVEFSVANRFVVNEPGFRGERTRTATTAILIPHGQDIDQYLLEYLKRSKWIPE